jgi:RNA polymerase sigma-70 factor (ECF subfamily)
MEVDHSNAALQGRLRGMLESFLAAKPLLRRVVGRIVRPDEIEDIVQETFIRSYVAARSQKIQRPRAFMVRTARNLALNYIDKSERKLKSSLEALIEADNSIMNEALMSAESVESQCQWEENFLVFCRAAATLPINCRRVFILRKVYGFSQNEISDYLGITPSTIEKHVATGLMRVGEYMLENGYQLGRTGKNRKAASGEKERN